MTTAPPNLLAARQLLLAHLPLSGTAVGIVGDTAHVESGDSYHLGRPEQATTGYAATESPRDKAGLCEYASALDIGWWEHAGRDLRHMSAWLVAQCKAGTADTRDIREIIYSLDGKTVHRWDRLGRRTTGDSSHLWHTHVSYFRDATKAGRDLRPLYTRYLTSIGLVAPEVPEMEQNDKLIFKTAFADREVGHVLADVSNFRDWLYGTASGGTAPVNPPPAGSRLAQLAALPGQVTELGKQVGQVVEQVRQLAATPPGTVQITDEQLERVLRRVMGSVDGASPPAGQA